MEECPTNAGTAAAEQTLLSSQTLHGMSGRSLIVTQIIAFLAGLIWVCLSHTQLFAQELSPLDVENGFLGISFGANLDTLKNFKYVNPYFKKDKFVKTDLPVSFSGVPLESVYFIFYKKQLHSVLLKSKGEKNSDELLNVLQMFYGTGEQDGMAPLYYWEGKKVKMVYDKNLFSKSAEVVIESRAMQNKFQKERGMGN